MGRKKSNPNAELEGLPQEIHSPEIEGQQESFAILIEALKSPYEKGSLEDKVFTLCKESHATVKELSTILCLDEEFLKTEMRDVIEKGYTACKILLRRQQFLSARDGDSKQLTWLGKQVLGQEDKVKMDIPMTIMISTGVPRQAPTPVNALPDVIVPAAIEHMRTSDE